ncbi:MAG: baseplate J/gp47 family protein [bacterium]|nr:baseplate J/gp47 family protein [bacterium]
MDFKSLVSFGRKKEPEKKFLALRVGMQSLTSVLWSVMDGKVVIGKTEHSSLPSLKNEDFLPVLDKVVSSVSEGEIPEPKEILFGLATDWVAEGKIIEPQLSLLRKTCRELELTPIGFVVIPEAIANYYKELESTPLTAILIGIEVSKLYVSFVRAGKIIKTEIVDVLDSSEFNVLIEQALKKFVDVEVLPSRMLIYNGGEDLEKLKEQILSYPWTQKLPFLHFPKIEIVIDSDVVKAVAIAGGTEMGGVIEPVVSEVVDTGFVIEQDIKTELPKAKFNFVDLKNKLPKLPKLNFDFSGKLPLIIGVLAIGILVIGIIGYVAVTKYVIKNQVVLTVVPKIIDDQREITIVTSGEIGETDPKILATKIDVEETGTKRGVATGKKIVGDKAKGAITIYGTTMGRTFPAGTTIISNGLKFVMDDAVTIASGSAYPPATATVNVTASGLGDSYNLPAGTYFEIKDYPQSSFRGKNDSGFTGGSSRQVLVVTKQDQDRLVATLSAELAEKGQVDLKNKLGFDQNILDGSITSVVSKKKFDRDVDTEADSVGLTLTSTVTGVILDQRQLAIKIGKLVADKIPADFNFNPELAQISISGSKVSKTNNVVLMVKFSAKLTPKIDTAAATKSILGKDFLKAQQILSSINNVAGSDVLLTPSFLGFLKLVSSNPANIKMEVVSQ